MARTPTGTITSVAMNMGSAVPITGISNAVEAVVSAAGHTLANGEYALVFSAWGKLNYRAFRVKGVVANVSFVLEGCDTSNTELYPTGGGAGSYRRAVPGNWVDMDRTKAHATSGGDSKTVPVKWTETDVETILHDGWSGVQRTFEMDADMIGTPAYSALRTLSQTQAPTIVRRRARTGAISLIPGTISFNEEEIETEGQPVVNKATINGQNVSTRYPAP